MKMPNRIRELRMAKNWTIQKLADLVGTSNQQIGRLEKGERKLTQDWMNRIGEALGVDPKELLPGAESPAVPPEPEGEPEASDAEVAEGLVVGALPFRNQYDRIPVLATARGGLDQEMFVDDGPIDHIPRPRSLEGVADAYAMAVAGDSMFPMFRHGNILHVNPHRRPAAGMGVVVWKHTKAILIKEYVRRTAAGVVVREYQPQVREFLVPEPDILAVHTVVGLDYD